MGITATYESTHVDHATPRCEMAFSDMRARALPSMWMVPRASSGGSDHRRLFPENTPTFIEVTGVVSNAEGKVTRNDGNDITTYYEKELPKAV